MSFFLLTAVHCNLSQNGIDHQTCPEDMTSQLEEEEEFVDGGAVLLDEDGPSFRDVSPPAFQRRSAPQRSVSESELTRVRASYGLVKQLSNYSFSSVESKRSSQLVWRTAIVLGAQPC